MKLVSLKIYNFGKFSSFEYSFESGLNTIIEENGWGKTTMLTFIRVMLYGFKNEKAKAVKERERNIWEPWAGGMYGGELVFENDGKQYLVQRVFGKKPADDTFILKDNQTMLESNDFSMALGEELFKLNLESFERTVFIGHDDCWTGANGDIASKLGNLTDDTDDVNNYEKVMKNLKDIENKYTDARVNGEVKRLKTEIAEIQTFIRNHEGLEDTLKLQYEKKEEQLLKAERFEAERRHLEADRKAVSEYKDIQAVKEKHELLIGNLKNKKAQYQECRDFFGEDIPTKDDMDMVLAAAGELKTAEGELRAVKVNNVELIEQEKLTNENLSELLTEVQKHRECIGKIETEENELKFKEMELSGIPEQKKGPVIGLLVVGILLLCGIVGFFVEWPVWGVLVLVVSGVIFIILSFVFGLMRKEKPERIELIEKIENLKDRLLDEKKICESKRAKLEKQLGSLNIAFNMYTVDSEIGRLKDDVENYRRYQLAEKQYNNLKAKIDAFYDDYRLEKSYDLHIGLSEIVKACSKLDELSKEVVVAKNSLEAFEKNYNVEKIQNSIVPENVQSLAEIDTEYNKKTEEIAEVKRVVADYEREIEKYQSLAEEKNEREAELKSKNEELLAKTHVLELSRLTQKYLEEAKTNLTAQYKNPLENGFKKYYSAFTGNDGGDYKLDANTKLYVRESNLDRDISVLSAGKQDVAWNCLRMAFVDAMYSENKPFLVMDDPFINLDDNNLSGSKAFMATVAKDYQVIYTTCSKARVL